MKDKAKHTDSHDETSYAVCRGCGEPIFFTRQQGVVDSILDFIRLACPNPDCERMDWYAESDCEPVAQPTGPQPEGTGEVWIHDLLLGLSFKAPARHA